MSFWKCRCETLNCVVVVRSVVVGSGSVPESARSWAAPTSAATRTHAHADMSVSLCRILVIPPDRRRLVTVPQSRTTGCQWSDARSVVELVKVVAGGAGLLNLENCQNPNLKPLEHRSPLMKQPRG